MPGKKPAKEKEEGRAVHKGVRFTAEEWRDIQFAARHEAISPSTFIRRSSVVAARAYRQAGKRSE